MKARIFVVTAGFGLLTSGSVSAHHSFAAEFDINQPITLEGVLTKIDWVNPHAWIYVDVTREDGTVESWAVETTGATRLLRAGLRQSDFPIGVEIVVEAYRARSGNLTANSDTIRFKDGRDFFLGRPGC